MSHRQIKIRDFGEKIRYLVGAQGRNNPCSDFNGDFPREFPKFKTEKSFAKKSRRRPSSLEPMVR